MTLGPLAKAHTIVLQSNRSTSTMYLNKPISSSLMILGVAICDQTFLIIITTCATFKVTMLALNRVFAPHSFHYQRQVQIQRQKRQHPLLFPPKQDSP